ncbi:MFS transporter [Streptomyces sp. SID13031]|uniref:MFS transporter n=1 Tax=Streptomyces sp. SID13031 TaxID=2706046 RepID=UPI0013C546BC|nr:MFS transporter [Streptomyces sp. SID13031]NEA35254.1 MFS transporter [Streptomyces sp. SID13031]
MSNREGNEIGVALAALGFLLAGLGACVAVLARDLDLPTDRLALLPSAFAVGLLVIAVIGPWVLRTVAISVVLRIGSIVCALGGVLIAVAPQYGVAIAGGLCVGLGGALLILIAPLLLNGPTAAARLTRVNAFSSATGILAPLAIGAVDRLISTGRLAMLAAVPPLLVLAVIARPGATHVQQARTMGVERRVLVQVARGWARVVLAVAVEFCFVIWAVARLLDSGLSIATAALLGSAFPIGMAVGRAVGPVHVLGWSPVVPGGLLAIGGTLLVSLFGAPAMVTAGLVVAGIGVAPLYPVTLAALVATPGLSSARLAALGASASGVAILLAPAILATLAGVVDLRTAFLITLPLLIALFLVSRPLNRGHGMNLVPSGVTRNLNP